VPKRTVIPLFLSSSRDCALEKQALKDAIGQYNTVARDTENIEVHAFQQEDLFAGPADPGGYAQQVANRQLEDYEIYVGVWRDRLGTPTPAAPSGTVEELERALKRFHETRRPWVMAYFWTGAQVDFSAVKSALKQYAAFYHHFENTRSLERQFTTHLVSYIRDQYRLKGHSTTALKSPSKTRPTMTFDVELKAQKKRHTFDRFAVAVGRQPERNEIIIDDQQVHREQGIFTWSGGVVFYTDLGGDSRIERAKDAETAYGHDIIGVGDAVVLPGGSRIVLRAVVD
jgi:hypothetical protein